MNFALFPLFNLFTFKVDEVVSEYYTLRLFHRNPFVVVIDDITATIINNTAQQEYLKKGHREKQQGIIIIKTRTSSNERSSRFRILQYFLKHQHTSFHYLRV